MDLELQQGAAGSENLFSDWSREALEEGIAKVKAKIAVLETEVAERKLKKIGRLKEGIVRVKTRLRALGVEPLDVPTRKRKYAVKEECGGSATVRKERKRKKRIIDEHDDETRKVDTF